MSIPPGSSPVPKNHLRHLALQVEKVYHAVHRFLAWATRRLGMPMTAEIYHATPMTSGVSVKGRVLLARKWREPSPDDPALINLIQMLKRWATPERPKSLVRVSLDGEAFEQRADKEGYFEIEIPKAECLGDRLLVELPESDTTEPIWHGIDPVGDQFRGVIVSDVDDTVLVTNAARALQMIATTLFGNALTRQVYPGTGALYQALHEGPSGESDRFNPILYVTSSPFNLHGLLQLIFQENGIPLGPFFMTDWGLDVDKWFKKSHREHKVEAIEKALIWYPEKPVILIGDSGQHDTEIYVDLALKYPDRIEKVLIHDVTDPERIESLRAEIPHLKELGTRFSFFNDSREAARILAEDDWISSKQLEEVCEAYNEGAPGKLTPQIRA